MSYGGRRPTPRMRQSIPRTWMVWLIATMLVATLGVLAVIVHAR